MILGANVVVAGKFRLVRELGRGGMASVWVAHHLSLDVPCAIKFIQSPEDAQDLGRRFEREAKAAARLRSSNVVQILDHGVWEGLPYIVMELLEGESLGDRLDRVGAINATETATIVTQVARALSKAHAVGIVHRDLKPDNVFLVHEDDRIIAKVLDFGIAKVPMTNATDGSTKVGALVGSPAFMSPEQADGAKPVDHRSDLWALGVIAFQCIVGHLPFSSEGLGDLLAQIMYRPLPVPSKVGRNVPPGFDEWWAKACARNPGERFQTARELSDGLSRALGVTISEESTLVTRVSPEQLAAMRAASAAAMAARSGQAPSPPGAQGPSVSASPALSPMTSGPTFSGQSRPPLSAPPARSGVFPIVLGAVLGMATIAVAIGLFVPAIRKGGPASGAASGSASAAFPTASATASASAPAPTASAAATASAAPSASSPVDAATAAPAESAEPKAAPVPTLRPIKRPGGRSGGKRKSDPGF